MGWNERAVRAQFPSMRSSSSALFGLVLIALPAPLLLPGCYEDASEHEHRGGCHGGESAPAVDFGCPKGISIELGDVSTRFASDLPVLVRACFDDDCDE